jgi:hypothetical protein
MDPDGAGTRRCFVPRAPVLAVSGVEWMRKARGPVPRSGVLLARPCGITTSALDSGQPLASSRCIASSDPWALAAERSECAPARLETEQLQCPPDLSKTIANGRKSATILPRQQRRRVSARQCCIRLRSGAPWPTKKRSEPGTRGRRSPDCLPICKMSYPRRTREVQIDRRPPASAQPACAGARSLRPSPFRLCPNARSAV